MRVLLASLAAGGWRLRMMPDLRSIVWLDASGSEAREIL